LNSDFIIIVSLSGSGGACCQAAMGCQPASR
jgi:hypothetical protein